MTGRKWKRPSDGLGRAKQTWHPPGTAKQSRPRFGSAKLARPRSAATGLGEEGASRASRRIGAPKRVAGEPARRRREARSKIRAGYPFIKG
ncbi:hypothetical protein AXF42_Ash000009 [Apostasia shenzhenica]|uniref:Uncharacterized protein n=1 Tax=Apostasia shenzhenica TaxID=1088818 RepID=A0A2I0AF98_9ASPA|nr:hypothetical protein AXF42_Ash000009 [Apostasia shenzhenica]